MYTFTRDAYRDPVLPRLKRLRPAGRESRDRVAGARLRRDAREGAKSQYDVIAGGETIFSKEREHRFPDDGEVLALLSSR